MYSLIVIGCLLFLFAAYLLAAVLFWGGSVVAVGLVGVVIAQSCLCCFPWQVIKMIKEQKVNVQNYETCGYDITKFETKSDLSKKKISQAMKSISCYFTLMVMASFTTFADPIRRSSNDMVTNITLGLVGYIVLNAIICCILQSNLKSVKKAQKAAEREI